MAMRAAVMAAVAPRGLNRLFATSAFNFTPPASSKQPSPAPPVDPSPNLFVSGIAIHFHMLLRFRIPFLIKDCSIKVIISDEIY